MPPFSSRDIYLAGLFVGLGFGLSLGLIFSLRLCSAAVAAALFVFKVLCSIVHNVLWVWCMYFEMGWIVLQVAGFLSSAYLILLS